MTQIFTFSNSKHFLRSVAITLMAGMLLPFFSAGQVFNGGGGAIIQVIDTSRFNINVTGLNPSSIGFNFGLESVTININHTRDMDVDCFLAAPDGTLIEL